MWNLSNIVHVSWLLFLVHLWMRYYSYENPRFCSNWIRLSNDILVAVVKQLNFGRFLGLLNSHRAYIGAGNKWNISGKVHFMNLGIFLWFIFVSATKLNITLLETPNFWSKWPNFWFHRRPADLMFHLKTDTECWNWKRIRHPMEFSLHVVRSVFRFYLLIRH